MVNCYSVISMLTGGLGDENFVEEEGRQRLAPSSTEIVPVANVMFLKEYGTNYHLGKKITTLLWKQHNFLASKAMNL